MFSGISPIVVGVDGSEASLGAVRWAAEEAVRQGRPLKAVHALGSPGPFGLPDDGEATVRRAAAAARGWYPSVKVETAAVIGSAAPVLCEQSAHARLVVVGSRGLGGFTGLLLGSVGAHLGAHAECPVLVVHHAERWTGPETELPHSRPVVVGVDGSPASLRALALGFEEAAARGVRLAAVRAWLEPDPRRHRRPVQAPLKTMETEALASEVEPWLAKFPDVAVELRVTPGGAAGVLVQASTDALMLVVGARGKGGFAGLRLGSVSQEVLHHTGCPVLVARVRGDGDMT